MLALKILQKLPRKKVTVTKSCLFQHRQSPFIKKMNAMGLIIVNILMVTWMGALKRTAKDRLEN